MSREDNITNKNPSAKPNTNAEALQDLAADPATDPQGIVTEGLDFVRSEEAPENESASENTASPAREINSRARRTQTEEEK